MTNATASNPKQSPPDAKSDAVVEVLSVEPIALRKWNCYRDEVSIHLTRCPDEADDLAINGAIRSFVAGLNPDGARLIAAAPELLAACVDALDQYILLAKDPATNPWVKQLRAAIAKATTPTPQTDGAA